MRTVSLEDRPRCMSWFYWMGITAVKAFVDTMSLANCFSKIWPGDQARWHLQACSTGSSSLMNTTNLLELLIESIPYGAVAHR